MILSGKEPLFFVLMTGKVNVYDVSLNKYIKLSLFWITFACVKAGLRFA